MALYCTLEIFLCLSSQTPDLSSTPSTAHLEKSCGWDPVGRGSNFHYRISVGSNKTCQSVWLRFLLILPSSSRDFGRPNDLLAWFRPLKMASGRKPLRIIAHQLPLALSSIVFLGNYRQKLSVVYLTSSLQTDDVCCLLNTVSILHTRSQWTTAQIRAKSDLQHIFVQPASWVVFVFFSFLHF